MRREPPRVLVLTGTSAYPYARLLGSLPALAASDAAGSIRVQAPVAPPASPRLVHLGMLSRAQVAYELETADVVVTHGGSGSVLESLGAGLVPVVVPRRRDLGEVASDHQTDLASELLARGLAFVPAEPLAATLVASVREAAERGRRAPIRLRSPGQEIRALLASFGVRPRRARTASRVARVSRATYDAAQAGLARRSPLQSSAWGLARAAEGWKPAWWIARGEGRAPLAALQVLSRRTTEPAYVAYGPSLSDDPAASSAAASLLRHVARRSAEGLLWAPTWVHDRLGLADRVGALSFEEPSTTGLVDLGVDAPALRRALRGTWRRDLEKAERDATLVVSFDPPEEAVGPLLSDVAALAERKGFTPPLAPDTGRRFAEGARAAGVLLLAATVREGDRVLARTLSAVAGHVAQTLWTAGSPDEKAGGAGRLALWRALLAARDAGARTYDLAGIDDAGNPGVALFKRGLSPELARVPGLAWIPPAWLPAPVARVARGPLASVVRRRGHG